MSILRNMHEKLATKRLKCSVSQRVNFHISLYYTYATLQFCCQLHVGGKCLLGYCADKFDNLAKYLGLRLLECTRLTQFKRSSESI